MSLDEEVVAAVERGMAKALAAHRPRFAYTTAEVGEMLGCSDRQVRRMVAAGLLDPVPMVAGHVTLGSIHKLVGLDAVPPAIEAVVDLDAIRSERTGS